MKFGRMGAASTACILAGALLAACTPAQNDPSGGLSEETTMRVAQTQSFYSYNDRTSTTTAGANSTVLYLTRGAFNYYDDSLEIVEDSSYGTYDLVSESPLTITYTVNDDVVWSDGVAVDAADLLLQWAATSTALNSDAVNFDAHQTGLDLVTSVPEISDDGKSITLVYDEPFADWRNNITRATVPAHITASRALDIEDAAEAKEALITAIQDGDETALSAIAEFWNTGYNFTSLPEDDGLYVSSGPYIISEFVENQFLTLIRNESYAGDLVPELDTITLRYYADPLGQVQALDNGEVDLINPQSTVDVIQALEDVDGIELLTGVDGTYEVITLTLNNEGPFAAAGNGGDADRAAAMRAAFFKAVPRELIVDNLIKPLNEDTEPRNSLTMPTDSPFYDELADGNGLAEAYGSYDPEGAKQILEGLGITEPVDVTFMYFGSNVRRQNTVALVQEMAEAAGFNVIPDGDDDMGNRLGGGSYDVTIFGMSAMTTSVLNTAVTYQTGAGSNFNGYSNPEVDALFAQLGTTTDEDEQRSLLLELEQAIVVDAPALPLYQWPSVVAWNDSFAGFSPISVQPNLFWNFWEWSSE